AALPAAAGRGRGGPGPVPGGRARLLGPGGARQHGGVVVPAGTMGRRGRRQAVRRRDAARVGEPGDGLGRRAPHRAADAGGGGVLRLSALRARHAPAPAQEGSRMATDVKVPAAGESISEVIIGSWLKSVGDPVAVDEPIVEVETDKATLEVPSPIAGVLTEQLFAPGDTVPVGAVVARVDESQAGAAASRPAAAQPAAQGPAAEPAQPAAPAAPPPSQSPPAPQPAAPQAQAGGTSAAVAEVPEGQRATSVMPAAQRLLSEHGLSADAV